METWDTKIDEDEEKYPYEIVLMCIKPRTRAASERLASRST